VRETIAEQAIDPSTVLARIVRRIDQILKLNPEKQASYIQICEQYREKNKSVWQLSPEILFHLIVEDIEILFQTDDPILLSKAVGILDAWHSFGNPDFDDFDDAPRPTEALSAEGRLDSNGAYNFRDNSEDGCLIPAACESAFEGYGASKKPLTDVYQAYLDVYEAQRGQRTYEHLPEGAHPVGANQLLKNTVWLPGTIECGHPDGTRHRLRHVRTAYVALRKASPMPLDAILKVSVAPLAETRECINLVLTESGSKYLIAPNFPIEKVFAAISQAFRSEAHILMLPEMTINFEWLDDISKKVRELRKENRLSKIRYIFLGVVDASNRCDFGRNFVVIMNEVGDIFKSLIFSDFLRQDKICKWHLSEHDQDRFGIRRNYASGYSPQPMIYENIREADIVFVIDIHGFGRLICLICASLEHNQPSDWLIQNVRPDWVYAPVMDSSTCWRGSTNSPLEKWTVRRAVRAACLSRGRVMVANSTALQDLENAELTFKARHFPDKPTGHKPNFAPAIGLMIDGTGHDLLYESLTTVIPQAGVTENPALCLSEWRVDWHEMPKSLA